jgi:hypothetical protein
MGKRKREREKEFWAKRKKLNFGISKLKFKFKIKFKPFSKPKLEVWFKDLKFKLRTLNQLNLKFKARF